MRPVTLKRKKLLALLLALALLFGSLGDVTGAAQEAETASEQTGAQAESEETEAVSSAASLCGHGNGGEFSLSASAVALAAEAAETVGAFTVTGGTKETDYSYTDNTLYIKTSTALTISTSGQTSDHICVESGVAANITLAGVNIVTSGTTCQLSLNGAGAVTITLAAGTTNTLDASATTDSGPGIWAPENSLLTINGTGELTAKGGASWPGIGRTGGCNILIESGTVTATGGTNGAGIGGSYGYANGTIKITGGTIEATGGAYGAGIGGGLSGSGGTITITGGTVEATGVSWSAGIGGGYSGSGGAITIEGGTVTATGNYGGAGIGGGYSGSGGTITITDGYVLTTNGGYGSANIGDGANGSGGTVTITGGYFDEGDTSANTVYGVDVYTNYSVLSNTDEATKGTYPYYVGIVCGPFIVTGDTGFTYENNVVTILAGGKYTITMNTAGGCTYTDTDRIVVGATDNEAVTLTLVSINVTSSSYTPLEVNTTSDVTILLSGDNVLTSTAVGYVGLQNTASASLTLTSASGDGETDGGLTATGGGDTSTGGAGIGGGSGGAGGTITINGGTVTAYGGGTGTSGGGASGAGTGGGSGGAGGTITITGGAVTATGGSASHSSTGVYPGAGIGCGGNGSGGTVTITGGTVTASGGDSNKRAHTGVGIGGGGSTIEITGGTVTAAGTYDSAGIGGVYQKAFSSITIGGDAVVTATGGENGAGIGNGSSANGGTVTISGSAVVTAQGGSNGAGIGAGTSSTGCTAITISGSATVNATGGSSGAGIGGSSGAFTGTITISGGYITATAGSSASAIGAGSGGTSGTITITGGYFGTGDTGENTVYSVSVASGYSVLENPDAATSATWPYLVNGAGNQYTVTLVLSGGTVDKGYEITSYTYGTETISLPTADQVTFSGSGQSVFDGWYESSDYSGTKVTEISTTDYGNKTYYARMVANPSYTVTIPAAVTLGESVTISAKDVTLDSGKSLVITLTGTSGEDSAFTVTSSGGTGSDTLAYTLTKGGTAVSVNDALLTVAGGGVCSSGSVQLNFALADGAVPKYSGTYSGTVTFTVSVTDGS